MMVDTPPASVTQDLNKSCETANSADTNSQQKPDGPSSRYVTSVPPPVAPKNKKSKSTPCPIRYWGYIRAYVIITFIGGILVGLAGLLIMFIDVLADDAVDSFSLSCGYACVGFGFTCLCTDAICCVCASHEHVKYTKDVHYPLFLPVCDI